MIDDDHRPWFMRDSKKTHIYLSRSEPDFEPKNVNVASIKILAQAKRPR